MTTRADAIDNANRWALEAERRHAAMTDETATRGRLDWADAARQMALMWTTIAQLAPVAAAGQDGGTA